MGEASEFLILRVSNLGAWQLTDSACRPVKGIESARGTFYRKCPGRFSVYDGRVCVYILK